MLSLPTATSLTKPGWFHLLNTSLVCPSLSLSTALSLNSTTESHAWRTTPGPSALPVPSSPSSNTTNGSSKTQISSSDILEWLFTASEKMTKTLNEYCPDVSAALAHCSSVLAHPSSPHWPSCSRPSGHVNPAPQPHPHFHPHLLVCSTNCSASLGTYWRNPLLTWVQLRAAFCNNPRHLILPLLGTFLDRAWRLSPSPACKLCEGKDHAWLLTL